VAYSLPYRVVDADPVMMDGVEILGPAR